MKKEYFKPSVTVDSIIFTVRDFEVDNYRKLPEKKFQVLLVKRGIEPFKDSWSLPGAFVREEEKFEQAVNRCLQEKANIKDIYLEQLYTWGDPLRDPRTRVISTSYMGLVDSNDIELKAGKDIEDIAWFDIKLNTIKTTSKENKKGYHKTEEIEIFLKNNRDKISVIMLIHI